MKRKTPISHIWGTLEKLYWRCDVRAKQGLDKILRSRDGEMSKKEAPWQREKSEGSYCVRDPRLNTYTQILVLGKVAILLTKPVRNHQQS